MLLKVKYAVYSLVSVLADALAITLSPIASLPIFIKTDASGRETIAKFWKWITTHDAKIDEYINGGYYTNNKLFSGKTRQELSDSKFYRYLGRIFWICRNPAYQVDHWLGFDQTGVDTTRGLYKDPLWDTGVPNKAFWKVKNARGKTGFLYQRQGHWGYDFSAHWKRLPNLRYTLELQFGWKLYRRDPDRKCMLAVRISPFKRYGG